MIAVDMPLPGACYGCRFNASGCAAMGRRFDFPLDEDPDSDKLFEQRMPWCPLIEIVRCQECKYSKIYVYDKTLYECENEYGLRNGDWFCPDGERREEGGKKSG